MTALADYKLPRKLRDCGVFCYSAELAKKVDSKIDLEPGSPEEVEIRAYTIYVVELIKKKLQIATSNQVNYYLWLEGQKKCL